MPYNDEMLNRVYNRTDGHCHICGKKLSFVNYAKFGLRGAWEVEHSRPRVKGGTDHGNNLFPACIPCNRTKREANTKTARNWYGRKCAPLSKERKTKIRRKNTAIGTLIGGTLGSVAGPWGTAIGATIGATIGHSIDPDKK